MERRATDILRQVAHTYYEAGSPASHTVIVEEWLKIWASNWSLHRDVHRAVRESSRFSLTLVENPICDDDSLRQALETFLRDSIEYLARITLRDFLWRHYVNGLEHGELVERWLRDHMGWFADQPQDWDCSIPKDQGTECHSRNPHLAIREAFRVIHLVLASCKEANVDQLRDFDLEVSEQLLEHISRYFKYLNSGAEAKQLMQELAASLPVAGEGAAVCPQDADVQEDSQAAQPRPQKRRRPT